jgi:ferrochelatase
MADHAVHSEHLSKPGLLMVNLGSPDSPTASDTRRYLAEFLHDYRVIDTSRWIWCPVLHGIILRVRPRKSAEAYESIWHEPAEFLGDEAPLVRITRAQVAGVQERLGEGVITETAMRYGNPSIGAGLDSLIAQGCTRIAVLPLYPQYAGATTASVYDGVGFALQDRMDVPELRFLRHYFDDPRFIKALAGSIDSHLATLDWTPDAIITSYHGLPQSYVDKGDPYQGECLRTTELLRAEMGKTESELYATFQSRFGPKAWLQPYTDKTLKALPKQGVKKVALAMPGFSADCLETLEEIAIEAKESFEEHGGTHFTAIPCLNADPAHLDLLADLARERLLAGWL